MCTRSFREEITVRLEDGFIKVRTSLLRSSPIVRADVLWNATCRLNLDKLVFISIINACGRLWDLEVGSKFHEDIIARDSNQMFYGYRSRINVCQVQKFRKCTPSVWQNSEMTKCLTEFLNEQGKQINVTINFSHYLFIFVIFIDGKCFPVKFCICREIHWEITKSLLQIIYVRK